MEVWLDQNKRVGASTEKGLHLAKCTATACEASMPRRPNYWWNDELANLRSACHRTKRMAQRAVGRIDQRSKEQDFKEAHKTPKLAIQRSKRVAPIES